MNKHCKKGLNNEDIFLYSGREETDPLYPLHPPLHAINLFFIVLTGQ